MLIESFAMNPALLISCAAATAGLVFAQSPVTQSDAAYRRMLESKKVVTEYLNRQARAITDRAGAEVSDRATWEKVREQRRGELLRIKRLQVVGLFAQTDEFDWQAQLLLDRDDHPTLAGTIELGDNQSSEFNGFVKLTRLI